MKTVWHKILPWKNLWISLLLIGMTAIAYAAEPQAETSAPAASQPPPVSATGEFSTEQLEQLVAPISLYPDSLLTQILMASTYPLEVVEADRFMKKNPGLSGDALNTALLDKDWDPSVKALASLPDVLGKMSENLDWTQDLGDAFLGQKAELMDTVQRMRGLAYDEGNLKTSEQQVVTQEPDKIIVIQSSDPEIIYVPTYSSTVVYGSSWGYPYYYYPPMYTYPPGYGLVSFGVGMAVGAAIWGNANWGWGGSDIDIDINRYNEFNRNTNINADRDRISQGGGRDGKSNWNHDASHRKGVNYRSQDVAQRNGAAAGTSRVSKDQARGRSTSGSGNRASAGKNNRGPTAASNRPATGANNRPAAGSIDRSAGASTRPAGGTSDRSAGASSNRASASNRSSASSRSSQSSRSNSAFSGSRSPSSDRMSSSRGASSRGTTSFGGGARGGGGRRR